MVCDKINLFSQLDHRQSTILDLGCGPLKRNPSWIGVDMLDAEGVDIVGDILEVLAKFPTNSVDEIHSYHLLEHMDNLPEFLVACQRILKPGGLLKSVVPHFSNPYYYSDYTHRRFFGLYSFSYLVHERIFYRKVPTYGIKVQLELKQVKLNFKSPLIINRPLRWILQGLFNLSTRMQEWYEDSWSNVFSCYEVEFWVIKGENS